MLAANQEICTERAHEIHSLKSNRVSFEIVVSLNVEYLVKGICKIHTVWCSFWNYIGSFFFDCDKFLGSASCTFSLNPYPPLHHMNVPTTDR
jgi:hypothetical protein